ncbi:hypothetical protein TRP66_17155 [Pseudomonas sp. JDS28PS106]|uniref:hypothetical protein n=1 Tax=Pseudomonas sp. JDS28PS106 TaxID=2497235 RepID=UPI002FD66742
MEINATSASALPRLTRKASPATPSAEAAPFAQIFKNVTKPTQTTLITPASATLSSQVRNARSMIFMENMPLEQRRSEVEKEDFTPQPAALERSRGSLERVLTQPGLNK